MRNAFCPVVAALLLCGSGAAAAGAHPAYYGGSVVSNPQVVVVSWGPDVDSAVVNGLPAFYSTILDSPYLDWVSEYSTVGLTGLIDGLPGTNQRIGRGNFVGTFTLQTNSATTVSNTDVLSVLQSEIAVGNLPGPTTDAEGNANTVYMVNFPPGVTVISYGGATGCAGPPPAGFCGATDTVTLGALYAGVGLIPDMSPASPCTGLCGTDPSYFNNATEVHAHVLLNLVTDMEYGLWTAQGTGTVQRPLGWYNVGPETQVADICTGQPALVQGYAVETGWSNTQDACVSAPGSPLPVCTLGLTYCRQCSSTDEGADAGCTGATQLCETDVSNQAFGECVGCSSRADCSGTTPICGKGGATNDTCRACGGDAECTTNAAGPHCLSSGACGPEATPAASSGCSSTAGDVSAWALVLALSLLRMRRPSSAN
jgi:hypothetical protein